MATRSWPVYRLGASGASARHAARNGAASQVRRALRGQRYGRYHGMRPHGGAGQHTAAGAHTLQAALVPAGQRWRGYWGAVCGMQGTCGGRAQPGGARTKGAASGTGRNGSGVGKGGAQAPPTTHTKGYTHGTQAPMARWGRRHGTGHMRYLPRVSLRGMRQAQAQATH